jgi:hypothetical protein
VSLIYTDTNYSLATFCTWIPPTRTTEWRKEWEADERCKIDRAVFVPLARHAEWKYLAHIPGQSYAARLKYLFMMRSTVLWFKDPWQVRAGPSGTQRAPLAHSGPPL